MITTTTCIIILSFSIIWRLSVRISQCRWFYMSHSVWIGTQLVSVNLLVPSSSCLGEPPCYRLRLEYGKYCTSLGESFCIWYYLLRVLRSRPVTDYAWNTVCTVLPWGRLSVFGTIFFMSWGATLLQTTFEIRYVLYFLGGVFLYLVPSSQCLEEPPSYRLRLEHGMCCTSLGVGEGSFCIWNYLLHVLRSHTATDYVWNTVCTVLPGWSLSVFGTIFSMSGGATQLQTTLGTRYVLYFLGGWVRVLSVFGTIFFMSWGAALLQTTLGIQYVLYCLGVLYSSCQEEPRCNRLCLEHGMCCTSSGSLSVFGTIFFLSEGAALLQTTFEIRYVLYFLGGWVRVLSVFGTIFFMSWGATLLQTTFEIRYVLYFLGGVFLYLVPSSQCLEEPPSYRLRLEHGMCCTSLGVGEGSFCIWNYLLHVLRSHTATDYVWNTVCTVLPGWSLSVFGTIFSMSGGATQLQTTLGTRYVLYFLGGWVRVLSVFGTIFFMSWGAALLQTTLGIQYVLYCLGVLYSSCQEEPRCNRLCLEHGMCCTSSGSLSVFGTIFFLSEGAALLQTTFEIRYVLYFLGGWVRVLSVFGTIFFMSWGATLLQTTFEIRYVLYFLGGVFLYLVPSSPCLEEPPSYRLRLEHGMCCTSLGGGWGFFLYLVLSSSCLEEPPCYRLRLEYSMYCTVSGYYILRVKRSHAVTDYAWNTVCAVLLRGVFLSLVLSSSCLKEPPCYRQRLKYGMYCTSWVESFCIWYPLFHVWRNHPATDYVWNTVCTVLPRGSLSVFGTINRLFANCKGGNFNVVRLFHLLNNGNRFYL